MINVAGIIKESVVDGPGVRFVIFAQGCPHHCPGCHNPLTWEVGVGRDYDTTELIAMIKESPLCEDVTFSGGEPMLQAGGFLELALALKGSYSIACYTGYTWEEIVAEGGERLELLRECDVIVDGAFILSERTLDKSFVGSKNQRIIDVKKSLKCGKPVVIERWE